MKYDLKNFRRAADRHVGDMDMSKEGRARLTKPMARRKNPLMWVGWAAMAACLIMMLMLNMPSGGDMRFPGEFEDRGNRGMLSEGDAPGIASPDDKLGTDATQTATAPPAMEQALSDAENSGHRADYRSVYTDYSGRAYYFKDGAYGLIKYDSTNFLTEDEARDSEAGQQYYKDNPNGAYGNGYSMELWPRKELVEYLPAIENATWQYYYTELNIGVVSRGQLVDSDDWSDVYYDNYALASNIGLITDFIYTRVDEFSQAGYAMAGIKDTVTQYPDDGKSYNDQSNGVIDGKGTWAIAPERSYVQELYQAQGENSDAKIVGYIREVLVLESESGYTNSTTGEKYYGDRSVRSELIGMNGKILLTAASVDYLRQYDGESGLLAYQEIGGDLWGYCDINGEVKIKPQYMSARGFAQGLAAVCDFDSGKYGFINTAGEYVIAPQYDYVPFGFDAGGTAQVQNYSDGTTRTINLKGGDVTNWFWIMRQRWDNMRESLQLDRTLSNLALMLMITALIMLIRSCVKREEAQLARDSAGVVALVACMFINSALGREFHSIEPGWFWSSASGGNMNAELAYWIAGIFTLMAGAIGGWSLRYRIKRPILRTLVMLIAIIVPMQVRSLLFANTTMDFDLIVAMILGEIGGFMAGGRRADAEAPLEGKLKHVISIIGLAVGFAVLIFMANSWNGTARIAGIDYSISDLSDAGNAWRFEQLLESEGDRSETDFIMRSENGEDWAQYLRQVLTSPEEYKVLRADITLRNGSSRLTRGASVNVNYHGAFEAQASYEYTDIIARGDSVVTYYWIVRTGAIPGNQWLAGFINKGELICTVGF